MCLKAHLRYSFFAARILGDKAAKKAPVMASISQQCNVNDFQ